MLTATDPKAVNISINGNDVNGVPVNAKEVADIRIKKYDSVECYEFYSPTGKGRKWLADNLYPDNLEFPVGPKDIWCVLHKGEFYGIIGKLLESDIDFAIKDVCLD